MKPRVIRTFYPADPAGVVPGGVDTFIRGLAKWAPEDLAFELVGMSTDTAARPLGRWTECDLGRRVLRCFPVVRVASAGQRTRVPLSVRYVSGLLPHGRALRRGFDVFEFHRIEPALLFLADPRPKNAFFHQDMGVIRHQAADILWRRLPSLYFRLERRVVRALDSGWCVREEGVRAMRERTPEKAQVLRFVPTWVDDETFAPADDAARAALRAELAAADGLDPAAAWVVSVGRLDRQKDPLLMLQAVARLAAAGERLQWLVVGDGVLRAELERGAVQAGIADRVVFLGMRPPAAIARILAASDLYALSSAYEGMPMALLEALSCGLPAVSTPVGEVARVLRPGVNGELCDAHTPEALAGALARALGRRAHYRGAPAVAAVQAYRPARVLEPVYEGYRRLARRSAGG